MFYQFILTLALTVSNAAARSINHVQQGGAPTTDGPPYDQEEPNNEISMTQPYAEKVFPLNAEERCDPSGSNSTLVVGVRQGGNFRHLRHERDMFLPGRNDRPRFLQSNTTNVFSKYDSGSLCGPSCKPSTCTCMANIFLETSSIDCATELNAVCNGVIDADGTQWNIMGCIYGYPQVLSSEAVCSLAACRVGGGSIASCFAQPFHNLLGNAGSWVTLDVISTTTSLAAVAIVLNLLN